MLDPERFQFETPNVIDPGEMPPSHPTRMEKAALTGSDELDAIRPSPNYSDHDDKYQNYRKPSISRSIPLNLYDPADNEPFCDDLNTNPSSGLTNSPPTSDDGYNDPEFGMAPTRRTNSHVSTHSVGPTGAQAREFAAKLLSESERLDKTPRKMRMSIPRRGKRRVPLHQLQEQNLHPLSPEEEADGLLKLQQIRSRRRRFCYRILMVVALALVLLGFVIGVTKALKNRPVRSDKPEPPVTIDTSSRMSQISHFLVDRSISTHESLKAKSSPQYKAAHWLATVDTEALPIPSPSETSTHSDRLIQRYLLSLLYYSMGGDEWTNSLKFLSENHECGWFDPVADTQGERCVP